jgi:taurine dioxygenase
MEVRSLSDIAGVEVEGVDLTAQRSPEEDRALGSIFDQHGLVVFRDQKLTKHQLVAAGGPFGGTEMVTPATGFDPEAMGVKIISTRGPFGDVVPEDETELVGDTDWHTDQGYLTKPQRGKVLYAVRVPEEGGMTGFIDGQATYDALPDATKKRIEKLHVIHSWRRSEPYLARNRDYRVAGQQEMSQDRFPDLAYPLVYEHPKTGAKVLNVPPLWAAGIVEMPGTEGEVLVEELKQHILQPQFQYWHRYRVGDFTLWDNWRFLHAAGGTPGRYVRVIWSISIQGDREFGRLIQRAA